MHRERMIKPWNCNGSARGAVNEVPPHGSSGFYGPSKKRISKENISSVLSHEKSMDLTSWSKTTGKMFPAEFNFSDCDENESSFTKEILKDWNEETDIGEQETDANLFSLTRNNSFDDLEKLITTDPAKAVPMTKHEKLNFEEEIDTVRQISPMGLVEEDTYESVSNNVLYDNNIIYISNNVNNGDEYIIKNTANLMSEIAIPAIQPIIVDAPTLTNEPEGLELDLLSFINTDDLENNNMEFWNYLADDVEEQKLPTSEPNPAPSEMISQTIKVEPVDQYDSLKSTINTIAMDEISSTIADRIKVGSKRSRISKGYTYDDEDYFKPPKIQKPRYSEDSMDSDYSTPSSSSYPADEYRVRRNKNNEASKKSRKTKKEKETELFMEKECLEREHIRLQAQHDELQLQIETLRKSFMSAILCRG